MLACPFCGAGAGLGLFLLLFGVFAAMFAGTVLLLFASWRRGDWSDGESRWDAVHAEERR